ncbi:hypothetical protein BGW39_000093 [Mortierella sp. 14UC]|nr:hypothetical protein BGW39_000093 [Mortierella sp. 14UC]
MGILRFNCMTTDVAGTTAYALTNTDSYQTPSDAWGKNMVLVKSNANPTSVRATTWSFLSSYSSKDLSIKDGIPTTAGCAVDSRGVVTFVAAHYIFARTDPFTKYITALRYDPAGATNPSMSQGTGSWSTLSLNPTFGPSTFEKIWLFHSAAAAGGAETLNLAYLSRLDAGFQPTIFFGAFDPASATFNPTGRWDMTTLAYGSPMSILLRGSEMYYYATSYPSGNAKLTVYSLANVATNTPAALRTYNTTVCTDIGGEISTALLQNSYYLTCSRSHDSNFTSLAILKDVTSASSTFAPTVSFASTFNKLDFIVALGNSNNPNSSSTSTPVNGALPVLLMQKYDTFFRTNLQFSMALSGPTFAVVEGGVDASIPEKFGIDPSTTTTGSYPYPTSGGGGSGGGGSGSGSTVIVVAGKLSVKIIIVIVVAALFVVGGLLAFCCGCLGACCLGVKEAITGEKSDDGPAVVEVQPDWAQGQKTEEAGVVTAGAQTYPVLTEHHQPYAHNAPLPQPLVQDSGLSYLPISGDSQSTAAPIATGTPPSPTVPRYLRPA